MWLGARGRVIKGRCALLQHVRCMYGSTNFVVDVRSPVVACHFKRRDWRVRDSLLQGAVVGPVGMLLLAGGTALRHRAGRRPRTDACHATSASTEEGPPKTRTQHENHANHVTS